MIKEICTHHPVKWRIVLGLLLVLLVGIQYVGAGVWSGEYDSSDITWGAYQVMGANYGRTGYIALPYNLTNYTIDTDVTLYFGSTCKGGIVGGVADAFGSSLSYYQIAKGGAVYASLSANGVDPTSINYWSPSYPTITFERVGTLCKVFSDGTQAGNTYTYGNPATNLTFVQWYQIGYCDPGFSFDYITITGETNDTVPTPTPTPTTTPTPTPTPPISGIDAIWWDEETYTQYSTAIITYTISDLSWDDSLYSYYLQILDTDGKTVLKEYYIATQPDESIQSVFVDKDTFPITGTYYCVLVYEKKSTHERVVFKVDTAYVTLFEFVTISGTTYDAINSTPISSVNVSVSQYGITTYTTSSTWGTYSVGGMYSGTWISVNGTKSGYKCTPVGFTPTKEGTVLVDLGLVPDNGPDPGSWVSDDSGTGTYTSPVYSNTNSTMYNTESGSAIGGYVYGGALMAEMSGATVNISNATWSDTYLTSAGGWYGFTELNDNLTAGQYSVSVTKPGYDSVSATVVIIEDSFARVDFYLGIGDYTEDSFGSGNTSYWNTTDGTACGGLIYLGPLWTSGSGVSVVIGNATWNNTYTTSSGGWYQFNESDGLGDDETYTLTVAKSGYETVTASINCVADNFTRKDFNLGEVYSLTVHIRDSKTSSYITSKNVTATLGTTTVTTSDGTAEFQNLTYGLYSLSVSADDYYTATGSVIVESASDTETIYLIAKENTEIGESGPSANYIPHNVRFTFVDATGNPITGATTTAIGIGSSSPWTWLAGVFGFDSTSVDIKNETLMGLTGVDGAITFLMIEIVQYRVSCVKPTSGINYTFDLYPKESEYFIRIGSLPIAGGGNYPSYSLNATTSGTNVTLFGNYTDTSGETSSLRFIVVNSTGGEVYNTSVNLTDGVGSAYYAVNNTKYDQYKFGLVAEHDTHGTIEKWIDITLKGTGRLIDFGEGWTDFMYIVMSLACIFLIAGCFGEMDVKMGAVLVPIIGGGLFAFIGWLPEEYGWFISIAGFMGVLYYIRSKAKELDQ